MPALSLVIPTYNRPDDIAVLLSLLEPSVQTGLVLSEGNDESSQLFYEVIISDDSTNFDTQNLIQLKYPWCRWIKGPQKGPGANRNMGASVAKGEWILFIDDDVTIKPDFLSSYYNYIKNHDQLQVVEGAIQSREFINSPFYRMAENLTGGNYFSANIAYRTDFFRAIGGFDEDLEIMEDLELGALIKNNKIPADFCKDAIAYHPAQKFGWSYIIRRAFHFRWMILLRYKFEQNNVLNRNLFSTLIYTTFNHFILQLRTSWHIVKKPSPDIWKNQVFWQSWYWITTPIVIPYLCFWEIKYRRLFKQGILKFRTWKPN